MTEIDYRRLEDIGNALYRSIKSLGIEFNRGEVQQPPVFSSEEANEMYYADSAILSQDEKERLVFFNLSAEELFGYTLGEALGMPSAQLVPEDHRNQRAELFGRVLSGEVVQIPSAERIRKSGETVMASVQVFPYTLDGSTCVAAVAEKLG